MATSHRNTPTDLAVSRLPADDRACEGVPRIRDEPGILVLVTYDRTAFLDAVQKPPEPTEKLVAALRRHRTMFG
jgi:uncharacterized protein (DUF1778 family)